MNSTRNLQNYSENGNVTNKEKNLRGNTYFHNCTSSQTTYQFY